MLTSYHDHRGENDCEKSNRSGDRSFGANPGCFFRGCAAQGEGRSDRVRLSEVPYAFTAAQAKKDHYKDPMDGGALLPMKAPAAGNSAAMKGMKM